MKRLTSIFSLLVLMLGLSQFAKAQTWDFTKTPDADVTALAAATSEWTYTESSNRYESKVAINGAIKAGGTELQMTKGLTVEATEKKIRIDVNNRLQLAGKNIPLTTPTLTKGQVVTIVFASTGDTKVTFDALTNLSETEGFTAADKTTTQTGKGTVTADGTVSFKCTTGSINVFSITIEEGSQSGGADDHSVSINTQKNQAVLTLSGGTKKYYNTESLQSIDFDNNNVKVVIDAQTADAYNGNVAGISFSKAEKSADIDNPEGAVEISKAGGWLESAYVEFANFTGADNYNVYVKGGQYGDYTKIDGQLIRSYGTYNRADALGLKASSYSIKVVPVANGAEMTSAANEVTNIEVKNFNRDGYAHYNATEGIGAYNNDGTLKTGARVIYVSKANAKTIALSMQVDKKEETRTGIQDIIQAYEKGTETRPLAIRIIGQLKKADMPTLGSSSIGLQVKGKGQKMNLTIEGVGNDATFHGFGVLVRNCQYVELRNFAVMMHAEDGISFDSDNEHDWGHHLDIFYGENKGGDKAKGDGSFDVKGTLYCTVSDNHFWDAGKCNLNSNGDEVDYVTYHHNWYDHSDSRHPRVRKSQHLHVFNNYYDGNSKYGIGATTGSCIFSEKNYFRNCKYPMLISKQGSDIHNGVGTAEETKGTFSKEDGGIIKAFDNYMTGQTSFEPYEAGDVTYSKHFDAYVVENRNDQVPAEVVTLQGGTGYNNFDTAADFYKYTPDAANDVPSVVTGKYGAGRCEHGDFQWTFNNATEDKNAEVITELSNALKNYEGKLVKVYGDMGATGVNTGGDNTGGDNTGGDNTGGDVVQPEGTILCSFTAQNTASNSMFTVSGNLKSGVASRTIDGVEYKTALKLESSTSISFTTTAQMKMTLYFDATPSIKVDNVSTKNSALQNAGATVSGNDLSMTLAAGSHTITKEGTINLYLIKLEPISE